MSFVTSNWQSIKRQFRAYYHFTFQETEWMRVAAARKTQMPNMALQMDAAKRRATEACRSAIKRWYSSIQCGTTKASASENRNALRSPINCMESLTWLDFSALLSFSAHVRICITEVSRVHLASTNYGYSLYQYAQDYLDHSFTGIRGRLWIENNGRMITQNVKQVG